MSTTMSTALVTGITIAIAIYGSLHLLLHATQDAREPPPVPTSIPFISSMIGLSKKKSKYYTELRDKHNLPIYTIRLPGARLYVVNSISLIPSVQRQYKVFAFPPLEAKLAMSVCGSSKTANDILNTNSNGDEGFWGYSITHYKRIHAPLSPGPGLDAMNRVMAQKVAASLDRLKTSKVVKLFDFIRHEITLATTDSVYGPQNPFQDPAIIDAFWKFQLGIMILLMELFPSILARESLEAREFMAKRFLQYFKEGGHNKGSALIKARYDHSVEHKVPVEDIARFEVGGAIGILTNTSPASFWLVYHLYSNSVVLEDCRQELAHVISDETTTTEDGEEVKVRTIDMSQVKASCPVMLSTLQEVLRLHTIGISTRLVMEDHMLDNKFLLKKGGTVMIPGPVQHTSTSAWGPDVEEFNHRRFLPKEKRHNPIAFRGFGGGTTLCPGRHFASTEILAFTAMLILRFEIAPVDGKWKHLTTYKAGLWEVTPVPDDDIEVNISPRAGVDTNVRWRILVTDSDKAMPLSAEDVESTKL
ncbi:cytochrome P450 [Zopfia rhizophila CBS 207.26]|uniref:Cytochrome P450 n=1 Tax=Zopfia rhizophila CBS 207.26 TaxID=1314779 RepID=A0A6A6DNU1_9PEZI|nr:cytochrome P450 [Zopfia rhizophila CBS 207.26]